MAICATVAPNITNIRRSIFLSMKASTIHAAITKSATTAAPHNEISDTNIDYFFFTAKIKKNPYLLLSNYPETPNNGGGSVLEMAVTLHQIIIDSKIFVFLGQKRVVNATLVSGSSRYPEGTTVASPENRILNLDIELAVWFKLRQDI
jgi:hypothetical protein